MEISGRVAPADSLLLSRTLSQFLPLSLSLSLARAQKSSTTSGAFTLLESGEERGMCRSFTGNSLTSLKYCHQHEDHCFRASLPAPANRPINHLEKPPPGTANCILFVHAAQEAQFLRIRFAANRLCVDSHLEEYASAITTSACSFGLLCFTERILFESSIPFLGSYICYLTIIHRIFDKCKCKPTFSLLLFQFNRVAGA